MIRVLKLAALVAALALGLTAHAASKEMQPATEPLPTPSAEQAVIEFMRPSAFGGAIKCAIFDITDGEPVFLGILAPKDKVVIACPAGKRLYMITGENADFMETDLAAGKTYRAIAIARMGAWKARFSLIPLKKNAGEEEFSLGYKKVPEWIKVCKAFVPAASAAKWYTTNRPSILKKKDAYMPKWNEMNESLKQYRRLTAEDGL